MCRYLDLFITWVRSNLAILRKNTREPEFHSFHEPINGHLAHEMAGECHLGLGEAIRLRPKPRTQNDGSHRFSQGKDEQIEAYDSGSM